MITLSFLIIMLLNVSCSSAKETEGMAQSSPQQDTMLLQRYLQDWRKDSIGCLKLRDDVMAQYLIDHIGFVGKTRKEVEEILGAPNDTLVSQRYFPAINEDRKFFFLIYYFDIHCEDGKPTPNRLNRCWIEIAIHPDRKEVVSVGMPCS